MNKNEIKSKKTKENLCNAYIEIYNKKDINHITIKEITDKSGYNRGTFYLYFKDVYDIHDKIKKELILKAQNNVLKAIKDNQEISLEDILNTLMAFYNQNEKKMTTFITKDSSFANSIKEVAKPMINSIFKKDIADNKLTDYLIEYHLSSIFGVFNSWIINKKDISIEELFNLLKKVITKGVFNVIKEL